MAVGDSDRGRTEEKQEEGVVPDWAQGRAARAFAESGRGTVAVASLELAGAGTLAVTKGLAPAAAQKGMQVELMDQGEQAEEKEEKGTKI
jgi:DNA-binding LacI/PurR family transcriptional regulator